MDEATACALLGIGFMAPPEEVNRRYRALVRRWHPDLFQKDPRLLRKAEAKMREINLAYQTLQRRPPRRTESARTQAASQDRAKPAEQADWFDRWLQRLEKFYGSLEEIPVRDETLKILVGAGSFCLMALLLLADAARWASGSTEKKR